MIALTTRKVDYETLCSTVEKRLCDLGHLVDNQFPMTQREVMRAGKTVGVYFCVHGPRSIKLTAICDFTKSTIIFYGSDGIRRESMKLPMMKPAKVECCGK